MTLDIPREDDASLFDFHDDRAEDMVSDGDHALFASAVVRGRDHAGVAGEGVETSLEWNNILPR